jgi:hypothetical protein
MIQENLIVLLTLLNRLLIPPFRGWGLKGGGGGQKTLATAGGQEAGNLKQVIEEVKKLL